jgi:hypothetical protein
MATDAPARIHELDFCDKVASWANGFFANADSPFTGAGIEGFGTGELRRKRKDLRFYDRSTGHLAITGEVRLPGAKGGESPYDPTLMGDAEKKAENANVQYFFTWNVNVFVLFDRSKWNVPLVERRVREWRLDRHLRSSADVARTENLEYIRTKFFPELLLDLGRIYRGQAGTGRWRRMIFSSVRWTAISRGRSTPLVRIWPDKRPQNGSISAYRTG